jgi:hypothetical protein
MAVVPAVSGTAAAVRMTPIQLIAALPQLKSRLFHSSAGEVPGSRGGTDGSVPTGGRSSITTVLPAFLGARSFLICLFNDT